MKAITIILFLFPLFACAQIDSVHKHIRNPYLKGNDREVIAFQLFSGACDGLNNAIQFHGALADHAFWNYNTGWKRKYKNFDAGDLRARYFLSKSVLVAGTDGWHATKAGSRLGMTATIIIDETNYKSWRKILRKSIIVSVANRFGFWLMYDQIFAK